MPLETLHGLFASSVAPSEPDPLLGALAITDTALPDVADPPLPVALVNTGGAGQVGGPAALAARRGWSLHSVTTTVADPMDPGGNVRRIVAAVDAARADGTLDEAVTVRIGMPAEPVGHAWEAAADEIAAAEFEAALPTRRGGDPVPGDVVVGWIDALLDRETPFSALDVDGATEALGLLGATAAAWDGHGVEAAVAALRAPAGADALATGRRWCRAVHVDDGPAVAAEVRRAVEAPGS